MRTLCHFVLVPCVEVDKMGIVNHLDSREPPLVKEPSISVRPGYSGNQGTGEPVEEQMAALVWLSAVAQEVIQVLATLKMLGRIKTDVSGSRVYF